MLEGKGAVLRIEDISDKSQNFTPGQFLVNFAGHRNTFKKKKPTKQTNL